MKRGQRHSTVPRERPPKRQPSPRPPSRVSPPPPPPARQVARIIDESDSSLLDVLDNLLKGAAGQAVQNLNIVLGLDERTGLL